MADKGKMAFRFNSVQLNIVTFVDVRKAVYACSTDNAVFMMDNSVNSLGQGTSRLQTCCKQGHVLNWIIYAMDMDRRPDGSWPPMVRISNIVFLDEEGGDVSSIRVCEDLKIFGPPDKVRSEYTPVYYYWAGTVPIELPEGVYRYRLVLELENDKGQRPLYLNLDGPSLKVLEIGERIN
ncbi:MAG: hypothetical protein LUI85_18215 [Bacteroides sp.]|nr:hypothetical protein [Bacteroides sp.]